MLLETTDIEKLRRTRNPIRVLAFFRAKRGKGSALEKILITLIAPTRNEEGNISYILHRQIKDPDLLLFDEIWTDVAALDEHMKKPYITSLHDKIDPVVDAPPRIEIYREVSL
jgi:quinol monooxygenase YgiN